MYNYFHIVNNRNVAITRERNGEKRMTVDDRKKKTLIDRLMFVFRPKRSADIVAYAEKIIDDYTGLTTLRIRRRDRRLRKAALIISTASAVACIGIICCAFKIFF